MDIAMYQTNLSDIELFTRKYSEHAFWFAVYILTWTYRKRTLSKLEINKLFVKITAQTKIYLGMIETIPFYIKI